MTIGQMLHQWLIKLDWFSTLFPRIPVPIQKQIEKKLADYSRQHNVNLQTRFANTEREMNSVNTANKRDGSGSAGGGGREYFDRNRERDRASASASSYSNRYERSGGDDKRYRSRSKERTDSRDSSARDRYQKDRGSDRSSSDKYYSKERSSSGGGGERREKDYYHHRDIDAGQSSSDYSRNRDRKYR